MSLSVHINFNGDCEAAFEFYAAKLGGEIGTKFKVKDSPIAKEYPAEWQEKIVHANIAIQGFDIAGADLLSDQYHAPTGFYLLLGLNSATKVGQTLMSYQ